MTRLCLGDTEGSQYEKEGPAMILARRVYWLLEPHIQEVDIV